MMLVLVFDECDDDHHYHFACQLHCHLHFYYYSYHHVAVCDGKIVVHEGSFRAVKFLHFAIFAAYRNHIDAYRNEEIMQINEEKTFELAPKDIRKIDCHALLLFEGEKSERIHTELSVQKKCLMERIVAILFMSTVLRVFSQQ